MTRAWVDIDLGALCRNGAAISARAGVPLLPMVKADGYGLGGLRVALALEALQPWGFGVATVAEGDELRRGGISRPIIVFTPILRTEIDALRRADLTPALGDPAVIESWAKSDHADRRRWRSAARQVFAGSLTHGTPTVTEVILSQSEGAAL